MKKQEDEIHKLKEENQSAQSVLAAIQSELSDTISKLEEAETQIRTLNASINDFKEKYSTLKTKYKTLLEKKKELLRELIGVKSNLVKAFTSNSNNEDSIEELRQQQNDQGMIFTKK